VIYASINHDGDVESKGYVLLVASDGDEIELTRRVYREVGIRQPLFVAGKGEDALRLLEDHPNIALVLLALRLPGVSGLEVLEGIRARPNFRTVPIVVFASDEGPDIVEKAYKLGANSCLNIPVAYEEFTVTLAKAFEYWLVVNHAPAPDLYVS